MDSQQQSGGGFVTSTDFAALRERVAVMEESHETMAEQVAELRGELREQLTARDKPGTMAHQLGELELKYERAVASVQLVGKALVWAIKLLAIIAGAVFGIPELLEVLEVIE